MIWAAATPPSRDAALSRIDAIRPGDYARTRNHLAGAVTGLSPYLTHGLLTLPEILARLEARAPLAVGHKLVYEFGWREFFRHVWSFEGVGILTSLRQGPLPEDSYAAALPPDIREARTGLPAVDEAVRTLYATGTLHNHARMWLASYVVHLRRVHWRAGADWLVAHLLDGDLASNHLSWQWVAGTASHKPYLFNAENVARYAPEPWLSPGSSIDRSYAELDAIARGAAPSVVGTRDTMGLTPTAEPALFTAPPSSLRIGRAASLAPKDVAGREVWLVHPWAMRAPPANLSRDAVVIGVYLQEHHADWPWPEARWRWVDAAMAAVTGARHYLSVAELAERLSDASVVRSVADPHVPGLLERVAQLDEAPALFPRVERPCRSFSQWWTRTTRGLERAGELL